MQTAQPDRAFEVFVKRTLSTIQKESWGRSKECKELREMCQNVLNLLHDHEQGHLQYEGSLAVAVLEPLYLACASSNPKIVDSALGCLHKLVAHAWLQGESSSGGQANDADVVSRVIRTVIRCGESSAVEGMQLAVIRALLTFTTAEHFVAHGDCLLAAVRMVFNLALGAEDDIIKRTASNALLQMLNTITKRVTAYQIFGSSTGTSRRSSIDGSLAHSHSHLTSPPSGQIGGGAAAGPRGAGGSGAAASSERSSQVHLAGRLAEEQQATEAALAAAAAAAAARWVASGGTKADGTGTGPSLARDSASIADSRLPSGPLASLSNAPSGVLPAAESSPAAGRPTDESGPEGAQTGEGSRTAQLATLAEQRDLAGLEAALGAATSLDEGMHASEEEGPVVGRIRNSRQTSSDGAAGGAAATAVAAVGNSSVSGQAAGPTYSLRTSSMALPHGYVPPSPPPPLPPAQPMSPGQDSISEVPRGPWSPGSSAPGHSGEKPSEMQLDRPSQGDAMVSGADATASSQQQLASRTSQPSQRQLGQQFSHTSHHSGHHHHHHHYHSSGGGHRAGKALRSSERDVLLVLTAFCRLASRESGVTEVDKYLAAGKLLALELVVKVLQNPIHSWDNVRDEFVRHLHQPLCLVLLRNCSPSDAAAFQLALRLLTAILLQPKLRKGLKAELGAFYPLLLLRPLEVEQLGPTELVSVAAAVPCLGALCSEAQLLVDLFVNYDCDLKAPNLYERTVQALSRLSQRTELDGQPPPAGPKQQECSKQLATAREGALRCLLSVVHCLDAWSAPLKEQSPEGQDKPAGGQAEESRDSESDGTSTAVPARANGVGAGAAGGPGASEAERFEAVKVAKSSLSRGLSMFNGGHPVKAMRFLISSGVVEDSPAGVAVFLRAHATDLDPTAIGEYLGHHEDFELAAMHAYVDQERYVGMSIDTALRSFLLPFRLPGEAQKIDRLMEAFAERYVRDNPGVFRNADAAYVLAFAVIMLNTDAHNPLAERRLDRAGFVSMTSLPTEDGGGGVYEPALPVRELEGIFDRIVAQEIVTRPSAGAAGTGLASGRGRGGVGGGGSNRGGGGNKLAAALGLRALVAPFRSAGAQDRKQVSNAERQRQQMMEVAELAVARGGGGGGGGGSDGSGGTCLSTTWHTCTHAAHTRPMLTVSGEPLTSALVAAVPHAADYEGVLAALVTLAELAGLMGLEELCEGAVAAVAAAAGVGTPAPFGTAAAARQLAALRALLGAVSSPDAGQLGSAWTIILRTASELEALVRVVTRPLQPGETAVAFMSPPSPSAGGGPGAALEAGRGAASSGGGGSLLTKVFGGLWGSGSAASGGGAAVAAAASNGTGPGSRGGAGGKKDGAGLPPPPVRVMPGAAIVMWAVTDGRQVIEQVYSRSATLDGEAVVVFVRALCAVSREELDATRPRVYSLQRLVEVANLNLAGRIRLIWSKLWAVLSAHLVMAACHGQQPIAAQAVDALRTLAGRVLEREQLALQRAIAGVGSRGGSGTAGGAALPPLVQVPPPPAQALTLSQSTWGASEGALRPFVAVLRLSDDPSVRAMALAAIAAVMTTHARGLGSGWRVAMEALRRAAEDGSPAVYEQALGALEVAVVALFRTAAAPAPAVKRTAAGAAAAAAAALPSGHDCYRETLRAILTAIRNPHQGDRAPSAVPLLVQVGDRLAARPPPQQPQPGGSGGASSSGVPSSYTSQHHMPAHPWSTAAAAQPPALDSAASLNGVLTPTSHRSLLDHLAAAPLHSRASSPSEDWALLMEVAADVAATPAAPRLAAAGLEASLDLMRGHSAAWGVRAWRVMLQRVVAAVAFRVPPALDPAAHPAEAADAAAAGLPLESISASFVARVERLFPLMCSQLAPLAEAVARPRTAPAPPVHSSNRRWSFDSDGEDDDSDGGDAVVAYSGRRPGAAAPDLYRELLSLLTETCLGWFRHPAEAVARVGLNGLARLLDAVSGPVPPMPVEGPAAGHQKQLQLQPQQEHRGWNVLLPLLSSTLFLELDIIIRFSERLRQQQLAAAAAAAAGAGAAAPSPSPLPAPFSGGRPRLDAEVRRLRCRCRMVVLLQRTLCDYTVRRAGQLPWSVTRQLVAMLVGVAQRLMGFNMREELPAELVQKQLQRFQDQQEQLQARCESKELSTKPSSGALAAAAAEPAVAVASGDGWGDGWGDDGWGDDDGTEGGSEAGARRRDAAARTERVGSGPADAEAPDAVDVIRAGSGAASEHLSPAGVTAAAEEGTDNNNNNHGTTPTTKPEQLPSPGDAVTAEVTAHDASPAAEPAAGEDDASAPSGTATVSATADAEAAEAVAGPLALASPVSAVSALPGARLHLTGAHLYLTCVASRDSMRPALARLEVEAADAAITVLLAVTATAATEQQQQQQDPACVAAATAAAAAAAVGREAREQLQSLCRQIVECSVAAHAAATAATPAAVTATPESQHIVAGSSWDHSVRAVVLARAIHVLIMLGTSEGLLSVGGAGAGKAHSAAPGAWMKGGGFGVGDVGSEPLALLPDVLVLLSSHQAVVRGAVADFLEEVVGPRLQLALALARR